MMPPRESRGTRSPAAWRATLPSWEGALWAAPSAVACSIGVARCSTIPAPSLSRSLRQPTTYFSILEELAGGAKSVDHLARATGSSGKTLRPYLETLRSMRLLTHHLLIGAAPGSRGRMFRIDDGFIRFWFRLDFPHQNALEEGLRGRDLWDGEISEFLSDHVAPTFEALCRRYVWLRYGHEAPSVGSWWGDALHAERRVGRRMTEELDVVAAHRRRLKIVGECKWTVRPMRKQVLDDLLAWKLPALLQEGRPSVGRNGPRVVLFCRAGFEGALVDAAASDGRIELVELSRLVETLLSE